MKFGLLTVRGRRGVKNGHAAWLCKCDCGREKIINCSTLINGSSKSCGCEAVRQVIARSTKHGNNIRGARTREYQSWAGAKQRCNDRNERGFQFYGARGICMVPRWSDSFENFLSDMGQCPPGLTLERNDVNGNYEPGNCRWATIKEQQNNKRNNIRVSWEGKQMSLTIFAEKTGVSYHRLLRAVRVNGKDPVEAMLALRSA